MASNATEAVFELNNRFLTESSVFAALEADHRPKGFLSEESFRTNIVMYRALCSCINVSGLIANILNMIVYWKMGFSTTANISLFTLALSDFMQSLFLLSIALFHGIYTEVERLRLSVDVITYLLNPVFWSVSAFGSWVTATISVERCVSVALPMKVLIIYSMFPLIFLFFLNKFHMFFCLLSCPINCLVFHDASRKRY